MRYPCGSFENMYFFGVLSDCHETCPESACNWYLRGWCALPSVKIDRRVEISIPEDKCNLCICYQIDWAAQLLENSFKKNSFKKSHQQGC